MNQNYRIGQSVPPPNDLPDHIRSLELDIASAPTKLINVRARLAAGTPLRSLLNTHYPTIKLAKEWRADYLKLNTAHELWLEETINLRDQLRCELILRDELIDLITNQALFLNLAAGSDLGWAQIYEILAAIASIRKA